MLKLISAKRLQGEKFLQSKLVFFFSSFCKNSKNYCQSLDNKVDLIKQHQLMLERLLLVSAVSYMLEVPWLHHPSVLFVVYLDPGKIRRE